MIPPSYKPARWRCALPVEKETGDIAIGFDVGAGFDACAEVVRLRISTDCARALTETLQGYLDSASSHSPMSSGSPSVDGSTPVEGQKV